MDKNKRRMVEGWIEKAWNHLRAAKEHVQKFQFSESIESSQECVELSVKAILSLLDIEYSPSHGWKQDKKQFDKIAEQIQKRELLDQLAEQHLNHTVHLPRLLFLVNFWGDFYIEAKYGYEVGNLAPAKDLCKKEDAELAERHAQECYGAASQLRSLPEEQLDALRSE